MMDTSDTHLLTCAIHVLGWITFLILLCKLVYDSWRFVYGTFLGQLLGHNVDLKECGPWGVVTGATDGIGKAFTKNLVQSGLNVVIISRTPAKLEKVAEELKALNNRVQVKTIAADFTDSDIYPRIKQQLDTLEVGILVNNVGMPNDGAGKVFGTVEDEDDSLKSIINCNAMSMVRMCHIVVPQMAKRKRGVIVNVGSITHAIPTPLLAIYGATKIFIDKFSQDLAAELRPTGVVVQTLHPGFVATKMVPSMKPSIFSPDADTFARWALKTIGLESRTAGYWFHKIQMYLADVATVLLPRSVLEDFVKKYLSDIAEAEDKLKQKSS